jgi:diacylglycerol kinase (CTP)
MSYIILEAYLSEQISSSKVGPLMINATESIVIIDLKKRSDIHLARKIWHVVGVGIMTMAYAYLPHRYSIGLLLLTCAFAIPLDLLRQKYQGFNELIVHIFKPIMRDQEVHKTAGTTYLLSGVAVVALIFPRDIVLLTLLFLAFADPIASYFGIKYGKDKIFGHKSIQGSSAAFAVCTILAYMYLYRHGILLDRILVVSLLSGLIGALAEAVPVWKLDDNFSLPVLSATSLWVVFTLFGAFSNYQAM